MQRNFEKSLRLVLAHEGGYVNHPKDPGGETNRGITKKVYDRYRESKGLEIRSVAKITQLEIREIYKEQYWDAVKADKLPAGVDYAVFDFAVNSGPGRAIQFLQRCVGAGVDGMIGLETLGKVQNANPDMVISDLCNRRLRWMKTLKTWKTFGTGWKRRVMGNLDGYQKNDFGVIDYATNMAKEAIGAAVVKTLDLPKPKPIGDLDGEEQSAKAVASDQAVTKTQVGVGGMVAAAGATAPVMMSASEKVAGHMDRDGWIGGVAMVAFLILVLIGVGLTLYKYKGLISERA